MHNTKNNIIHIAIAPDNNYVEQCSVVIMSIIKNTKSEDKILKFHILDGGISDINKQKLLKIKNSQNIDIIFYDMSCFDCSRFPLNRSHITISSYYRLFLTEILSSSIKKVIYLDCDVVVKQDISLLWNHEIENYNAIVVEDETSILNSKRLDTKQNYFNSGVMVFNLEKLRKVNFIAECCEYYDKNQDRIIMQDQDILNGVLDGSCYYMPLNWNANSQLYHKNKVAEHYYTQKDAGEAMRNPAIIHFTGCYKPWDRQSMHIAKQEYLKYLEYTPFKHNILQKLLRKIQNFIYVKYKYYGQSKLVILGMVFYEKDGNTRKYNILGKKLVFQNSNK